MVRLDSLGGVFVKLEYMNPTGSHKDRVALYMLADALRSGEVSPGETVVEASSGNTAISVAWVGRALNLKVVIVAEETISPAKAAVIRALGAELVIARRAPPSSPENMVNVAERLARERGWFFLKQHSNESNVRAHYETTAEEILRQVGRVDAFVMGVGTGGTIAGVGRRLREVFGDRVRLVAVVPRNAPLVKGPNSVGDCIDGLACYTIPGIWGRYRDIIDEVVEVSLSDAVEGVKELIRSEGVLAGPSTGAALKASLRVLKELGRGSRVVTIAADSIFKYPHILG